MSNHLTRFERARLIGTRATQLSRGARPKIPENERMKLWQEFGWNNASYLIRVAEAELNAHVMPLVIRRYATDGTATDVFVRDLKT